MKDEKFSDDEINQFYKNNVKNRNENIMTKYIIQMKMCENRTQEVKADLSYAFNKWKNDH